MFERRTPETMSFPGQNGHAESLSPADPSRTPDASRPGQLAGLHILVVDHSPVSWKVTRAMLTHGSATSDPARSIDAAVQALQEQAYDVVLINLELPDLDAATGLERLIAAAPPDRRPPLIGMADTRWMALNPFPSKGLHTLLPKPLRLPVLVAAIKEAIAGR